MTNSKPIERNNKLYLFWLYTLLVILWGAWVRISHSGNGCGDHWPLCHGEFVPGLTNQKTLTEFFHRLMSGAYGIIVLLIYFKLRKHENASTRILARALLIFMLIEALVGALLVKQNLVTVNDSVFRLVVMCLHQLNSFLLTGCTFLLAYSFKQKISFKLNSFHIIFLTLVSTGAIASLAATLFPSISLWEGILKDFANDSHLFIKLRVIHPFLALTLVSFLIFKLNTMAQQNKNAQMLILKLFIGLLVGIVTLLTLSPIWLKMTHLVIAHYLWSEILKYHLFRQHQAM